MTTLQRSLPQDIEQWVGFRSQPNEPPCQTQPAFVASPALIPEMENGPLWSNIVQPRLDDHPPDSLARTPPMPDACLPFRAAGDRGDEQTRRFGPRAAAFWAARSQDRAAAPFRRGQGADSPDPQPEDERGQE